MPHCFGGLPMEERKKTSESALMRPTMLFLLIAALALAPCDGIRAAPPGKAGSSAENLQQALQELVALPGGPPGVIVLIQRGQRRSVYQAGVADIASERPPRPYDYMRIASVSKAFSGAAALALVADGLLDLDDTIGERLPDLPAAWHAVTLRQALQHTSGLPDYTKSKAFGEALLASPTHAPSPRELLDFVADQDLIFEPPGSQYAYSNSDNIVIGLMVEAVSGRDYAHALRKEVFRPLRLRHTSLPSGVDLPRPYLHGYELDDPQEPVDVSEAYAFGGWAWASGGIVSSPSDLNRFVRGYVGGRLFGRRERRQQHRFLEGGESAPPGPGDNAAGLALFRYDTRCGTVFGHTGSAPGYTQLIAATRDGHTSLTFSVNTQIREDLLPALRHAQELAVCAALPRHRGTGKAASRE
jgi:D-alanyl-D-alanine carboxypeptidase